MREGVLVTGGASGIGLAVVQRLRQQGLECIVVDRNPMPKGEDCVYLQADLSDESEARRVFAEVAARGNVTRLVNNVGLVRLAPIEEVQLADIDACTRLNVGASILAMQALLPGMRAAGFGRVVNISSRAALGKPLRTAYAASKAAVQGITRTWALEVARWGITVNAVAPGPIATPLFELTNAAQDPMTQEIKATIPVGRMGRPEDIAGAVEFFLATGSGFVTGQVLYVCGGMTVGLVH